MKMIVMAGGSGTRLWPLSRTYYPKQFVKLAGMSKSIFQLTIDRCLLMGSLKDIYIVTSRDYLSLIDEQINEMVLHIPKEQILLEPQAKNTLPAIMFAVQAIRGKGEDICAVFAADHVIDEPHILADTILGAAKLASKGFVCFGIEPDSPETGYGYIKPGMKIRDPETLSGEMLLGIKKVIGLEPLGDNTIEAYEIDEFKEKPNSKTAEEYVKSGYLWNSGMFMFHSEQFVDAVRRLNPDVYNAFENITGAVNSEEFYEKVDEAFKRTPGISVDYGLVERLEQSFCVPLNLQWNDLGSFTSFYDRYKAVQDENGNILLGDEVMLGSNNNLIYSQVDKAIAVIGVSDIVVVDLEDALLICNRDETQKVRDVVNILRNRKDCRVDYLS